MGGIAVAILGNNLPHPVHLALSPEEQGVRAGRLPDHLGPLMQKLRPRKPSCLAEASTFSGRTRAYLVGIITAHVHVCFAFPAAGVSLLSSSLARGCPC